jgi:ABC-2 type transport system permease protein
VKAVLLGRAPGLLRGVGVVAAREIGAAFDSAVAPVYLAAGVLLLNGAFMNDFFLAGKLDMTPLFDLLLLLSVALLPALTMRSWAEDRRQRTFELWMTLPLRTAEVVLGKYLASLVLWALFLAGTLPVVALLFALGEPEPARILSGYLAGLLLGGLFCAAGLFFSSLTGEQIVAFAASVLFCFLLVASGHPRVVAVVDGMAPGLGLGSFAAEHLSVRPRYERVVAGLLELSSLIWFAGLSAAFLWLNAVVARRLRP